MAGYDGRGARFNIVAVEGNDLSFTVTAVDDAAAAINLSAATITASIYNGAGTVIDTLTDAVSGAGSNIITLTLTDTEVDALTEPKSWALVVERGGDARTWLAGSFTVSDASRARNGGTSGTALTATVDSDVNVTVTVAVVGANLYETIVAASADTAPDPADLVPFVDVTQSRVESVTVANLAASTAFAGQYAPVDSVSVANYGAVGDGVTDDTDAIADALTAAVAAGVGVYFPEGTFLTSAPLVIATSGMTVRGAGMNRTTLRYTSSTGNLFEYEDDTAAGLLILKYVSIEDMLLDGPGAATATVGVYASFNPGTYNGSAFHMKRCRIQEFGTGGQFSGWDGCNFTLCEVFTCGTGLIFDDNGNTINLTNTNIQYCTTVGVTFEAGYGVIGIGGEFTNNPIAIIAKSLSQVSWVGGNFESHSGAAFIDVEVNATFVGIGNRFLKGAGSDIAAYRTQSTSALTVITPVRSGFTTAPLVTKSNASIVQVLGEGLTTTSTNGLIAEGGSTFRPGPFTSREDNWLPTAAAVTRNLAVSVMARDSQSTQDRLIWVMRDRTSGSDVYSIRDLANTIRGAGSPEGSVTAAIGTIYARTDATAGTGIYVKESGTGNTGWVPVIASSPAPSINKSAWWIRPPGTANTAAAVLSRLTLTPLAVPATGLTLDRIACEVTTAGAAGAVVRLGIFRPTSTGQFELVLDAGTVPADGATGVAELTISQSLAPGLYFLGAAAQVAASTVRTTTSDTASPYADSVAGALSGAAQAPIVSSVTGAFAGPYTASFTTANSLIRVAVRVA